MFKFSFYRSLPHIPSSEVLKLDLSNLASLMAYYTTSKSAEARNYASQLSTTLCTIVGYTEWSKQVKLICKPMEAVSLLKHLTTTLSAIEGINESTTNNTIHNSIIHNNNISLISPSKRIPLCEYLREQRSSQKRHNNNSVMNSPNIVLASPIPITSFSPGIPLSINHRRISKSPVLVLKRNTFDNHNNTTSTTPNMKYNNNIIETPITCPFVFENISTPLSTKTQPFSNSNNNNSFGVKSGTAKLFSSPSTPKLLSPTHAIEL